MRECRSEGNLSQRELSIAKGRNLTFIKNRQKSSVSECRYKESEVL